MDLASERSPVIKPPFVMAGLLVTSTMGAEERGRALVPLIIVVLVESLMSAITTVHAKT